MARAQRREDAIELGAGVRANVSDIGFHDGVDTRPGPEWPVERRASVGGGGAMLVRVLEHRRPAAPGCRVMLDGVDEVVVGRGAGGGIERTGRMARLVVGDFETSRRHLVVRRTRTGWEVADLGSRNGTLLGGERVQVAPLCHGDVIEAGGAMLMFVERAWAGEARDRDLGQDAEGPAVFRTLNVALERQIAQVVKIAASPVPVLVQGETGTGKELMARAIHDASGRRGAFVAINCGALPRNLIESELFGYRRGAFSGASEDRSGLIRRAHLGTLFLDEIAELPPESQVALLRVLQEGEVRPLGASEPVKVDIRIVAATHQDLRERIASGRFRQDLYGRIAGFEVRLPALRDRMEDLGVLIATILGRACERGGPDAIGRTAELAWDDADRNAALARSRRGDEGGPGAAREDGTRRSRNASGDAGQDRRALGLSKAAARALLRYPWPLNVRELEQTLRSAVALCDGRQIDIMHLPEAIRGYRAPSSVALTVEDRVLRQRVVDLLGDTDGNVAAVARALDRAPNQIRRWCRRLRIDLARYRQELI